MDSSSGIMKMSNSSGGCIRSDTDQPSSLPTTNTLEDVPEKNDSFYRALLREHQKMMFMDDMKSEDNSINSKRGESLKWEVENSHDRISDSHRSSPCGNKSQSRFRSRDCMLADLASSGSTRSRLPSSLHEPIEHGTADNDRLGHIHGKLYTGMQRSRSDKIVRLYPKLEPTASSSSSPLPCDLNVRADSSTSLSRMSSFYQEALKEAEVIKEGNDDVSRQIEKQDQEISFNDEYCSTSRVLDGNDVANSHTLTRTESNGPLSSVPTPISPFYRAALEDAALAEEEQLVMLQKQRHNRNEDCQRAASTAGNITTGTEANGTSYTPSSFYRSALREAIMTDQELERQGETEGDEDCVVSTASRDPAGPIQGRPHTIMVDRSALQHDLAIDPDATLYGRDRVNVGAQLSTMYPFSPSSTFSDLDTPSIVAVSPDRRSRSFVDDSCDLSVTRSSTAPYVASSVLPAMGKEAGAHASKKNECLFTGNSTFHDSRELNCSKNISQDIEDDESDEDLQIAIYLSRFESSAASSSNSEGASSGLLSTGERRENKIDNCADQIPAVPDLTESDSEFLISQFKAMEECQRNNSNKDCSLNSSRDTSTSSSRSSSRGGRQSRRRSQLEARGASETREAISNGNSRVVKCKGCTRRLQAPVNYSLVFCPKCHTVSPA